MIKKYVWELMKWTTKGGCFAENLVVQQVPLISSVTLRGETVVFKNNE